MPEQYLLLFLILRQGFPDDRPRSRDKVRLLKSMLLLLIGEQSIYSEPKWCCKLVSLDFADKHLQTKQYLFSQKKKKMEL